MRKMLTIISNVLRGSASRNGAELVSESVSGQMVDQHQEMMSTALIVSRDQDTQMTPRDISPVKTFIEYNKTKKNNKITKI